MKNLLILVIISLFGNLCSTAQESATDEPSKERKIYFEPGINCTKFLLNFADIKDSIQTPYALILTVGTKKIRLRVGINYQHARNTFDEIAGFKQETYSRTVNGRVGVEFTLLTWKKLQCYGGIDGVFHNRETNDYEISSIDVLTEMESGTSFGGGLAAGLKYYINDRLSLSTETTFYALRTIDKIGKVFRENPQFDEVSVDKGYTFDIDPPVSLFLNFKF